MVANMIIADFFYVSLFLIIQDLNHFPFIQQLTLLRSNYYWVTYRLQQTSTLTKLSQP